METNNFFHELVIKGIGDANTVSSGPDSGANSYMAKAFWNCMRHATTDQAINNWLSRIKSIIDIENDIDLYGAGNLNIGGHGNEGLLETGCGQTGISDYKTNFITTWNRHYYESYFAKLQGKNYPIIYIYSCHTGAGEMGAELLYILAQITGKPVAARTGFTYSNSNGKIWFENGSVWQVATPTGRPTPIEAPTPHFQKADKLKLFTGKHFEYIEPNVISNIKIEKTLILARSINIELDQQIMENKQALFDFFSSDPFRIEGELFAFKTAKITFDVALEERKQKLNFVLYNNRIIADEFNNYYYTNPIIQSLLKVY